MEHCGELGLKSAQGDLFSVPIRLLTSAFQEFVCQTSLRLILGVAESLTLFSTELPEEAASMYVYKKYIMQVICARIYFVMKVWLAYPGTCLD